MVERKLMQRQIKPQWTARSYANISIAAAIVTIGLKSWGYWVTGSVGLLSDALESVVNLVAAIVAAWMLAIAAQPPDAEHSFGHSKFEYFSSALEGILILVAAFGIVIAAVDRLIHPPQALEQIELGIILMLAASLVNGVVAYILLKAGRRLRSITLRADAHHLLTDVWTSVGVILGLILVKLTGWIILDAIAALIVAVNIVWTGIRLLAETGAGLVDSSLPPEDQKVIEQILRSYAHQDMQFHALRTRTAGIRRFVSLHVLLPGEWTIQRGHELCDRIEIEIATALPHTNVMTHLEPIEDPVSWADENLDRDLYGS
jgi:cation diffusion facilitator family transporter